MTPIFHLSTLILIHFKILFTLSKIRILVNYAYFDNPDLRYANSSESLFLIDYNYNLQLSNYLH